MELSCMTGVLTHMQVHNDGLFKFSLFRMHACTGALSVTKYIMSWSLLTHDISHIRMTSVLATKLTSAHNVEISLHKVLCPCPLHFTNVDCHDQCGLVVDSAIGLACNHVQPLASQILPLANFIFSPNLRVITTRNCIDHAPLWARL